MLKILLGRKLSGKSHYCIEIAKKQALADKKVVMLVPEQYSFECQRLLLTDLGPAISNKIDIHSFTSLCEELGNIYGGNAGRSIDDGTRFILTRRAIESVKDSLLHYDKFVSSTDFINKMVVVIGELKKAAVNPVNLLEFSKTVDSDIFKAKLHDVSIIMTAYDALVENVFIEPLDLIEKTIERLPDNSYFSDKVFIIDEFKGFTEAQFKLLSRIIAANGEVYATFCCDGLVPSCETDIFLNVKKTANRFFEIASAYGIKAEVENINFKGYSVDGVAALEKLLVDEQPRVNECVEGVSICKAKSVYDEVDYCLANIRKNVREKGYRYKDFVIISRNANTYNSIIANAADNFNIPCFTDSRVSVSTLPLSVLVVSAIKATQSLDTESILRYLKTGLAGVGFEEITALENYVYIWSINGNKWLSSWDMNTQGLQKKDDKEALERINDIRSRTVLPLVELKKGLVGTVENMCCAIFKFLGESNTIEQLKKYAANLNDAGRFNEAKLQSTGYDIFVKTLDKIVAVMGDEVLKVADFAEVLSSSLSFETVGEIPQTKDQVLYGTADRIRPMHPKVVFVLGANQDIFPQSVSDTGVFSFSERDKLIDGGFAVSDCHIGDLLDEKFLFYSSCCCASEKVYISYCESLSDGKKSEPSSVVRLIEKAFPNCEKHKYGYSGILNLDGVESHVSGFERVSENYFDNSEIILGLKDYFSKIPEYNAKLKAIEALFGGDYAKLSSDSASLLYGDELSLSASKIDDFNGCHFLYFCRYGLGAKVLNKVDFDAMTRGNIVHYVLEQFVNAHKKDIGTLSDEVISSECDRLCDEYIAMFASDTEVLGQKFVYMLSMLKETAALVAIALNAEFAQSQFKPQYCELKVGNGEPLESVKVKTDNGTSVSLRGSIDRVDTTTDGKVRVVDYKTGVKEFKLSSVLSGMNMQMLLYLYTAVKNGTELLKANIPAGILYFPARRNITDDLPEKYIKMNGLIDGDIDTVKQMEENCEGKIVPAKLRSNGGSFYSSESMVNQDGFKVIFKYLDVALKQIGEAIMNGDITALPLKVGQNLKCDYCDYRAICKLSNNGEFKEVIKLKTAETLEKMENVAKGEE